MFTIEQSKQYLLNRLSAEQSSSKHLEDELLHFALRLQRLLKRYYVTDPNSPSAKNNLALQDEIKRILNDFIDTLIENTELLSDACNQDRKELIIAFIHKERNGMTFDSRLNKWSNMYLAYLLSRFSNEGVDTKLNSIPIGSGAQYGIDRLLRSTIAVSWMDNLAKENSDAKSFICHRGSSYPCSTCDDMCEVEHNIADYDKFAPPYHPNCCCWVEFK